LGAWGASFVEVPPAGGVGEALGVPFEFVFGAGAVEPGPAYISTPSTVPSEFGASEQPHRAVNGKSVRRAVFVPNRRFTRPV
jgi:hypothetical protein